ncbi:MAG TPA: phospholipid carrier-dependent glycosyltransferase [Candidatus Peribacteraceae bacterium]|nr:phospholipid carrier-dependent glycosyltransferase [Candidatus Peribacteraceae bacterium]
MPEWKRLLHHPLLLPLLFVTAASYVTYVHDYTSPAQLFWDENYHIASAQKYLNDTFFMEPHPPLGKLMIALGEAIISPAGNGEADQFIDTDYARDLPAGFSFAGYRLFPTLLAWFIAPLLFGCFYFITRKPIESMLLSSLYIFDNALIVHSRSAMLESTLLFGAVTMIFAFLWLWQRHQARRTLILGSLLFGAALGWTISTKVNGLIMILLIPPLLWRLRRPSNIARFLGLQTLAFLVVYLGIWQIHFALGGTVNPKLPDNGYYQASVELKQVLDAGEAGALRHFPLTFSDHFAFLPHYQQGVPRLDVCKSDENGSYPLFWPLGAKTINYRWETPDGEVYRYLYLVVNPVVWFFGLAGLVLGVSLLAAHLFLRLEKPVERPLLIATFLAMYAGYMFVMFRIDRVLYLYHYFIPLVFSFMVFALAFMELSRLWKWKITEQGRIITLLTMTVLIIGSFHYYRPLTYNEPISDAAFQRRSLLRLWDLQCVNCERNSVLFEKTCS